MQGESLNNQQQQEHSMIPPPNETVPLTAPSPITKSSHPIQIINNVPVGVLYSPQPPSSSIQILKPSTTARPSSSTQPAGFTQTTAAPSLPGSSHNSHQKPTNAAPATTTTTTTTTTSTSQQQQQQSQQKQCELPKPGFFEQMWRALIRPPSRVQYTLQSLGQPTFIVENKTIAKREDFQVRSSRGYLLECSFYSAQETLNKPHPCVLYLHGNSSSRVEGSLLVPYLIPYGISLIIMDFAGCGLSEGEFISLGFYEKLDAKLVLAHVKQWKPFITEFGIWGRSMGAATTLMATLLSSDFPSPPPLVVPIDATAAPALKTTIATNTNNNNNNNLSLGGIIAPKASSSSTGSNSFPPIRFIVIDSSFISIRQLSAEIAKDSYHIPSVIFSLIFSYIKNKIESKAHFDLNSCDALNAVKQAKSKPTALFLAAINDTLISSNHTQTLFDNYKGSKQFLKFEGTHNSKRPREILFAVTKFFYNGFFDEHAMRTYQPFKLIESLPDLTKEIITQTQQAALQLQQKRDNASTTSAQHPNRIQSAQSNHNNPQTRKPKEQITVAAAAAIKSTELHIPQPQEEKIKNNLNGPSRIILQAITAKPSDDNHEEIIDEEEESAGIAVRKDRQNQVIDLMNDDNLTVAATVVAQKVAASGPVSGQQEQSDVNRVDTFEDSEFTTNNQNNNQQQGAFSHNQNNKSTTSNTRHGFSATPAKRQLQPQYQSTISNGSILHTKPAEKLDENEECTQFGSSKADIRNNDFDFPISLQQQQLQQQSQQQLPQVRLSGFFIQAPETFVGIDQTNPNEQEKHLISIHSNTPLSTINTTQSTTPIMGNANNNTVRAAQSVTTRCTGTESTINGGQNYIDQLAIERVPKKSNSDQSSIDEAKLNNNNNTNEQGQQQLPQGGHSNRFQSKKLSANRNQPNSRQWSAANTTAALIQENPCQDTHGEDNSTHQLNF